MKSENCMTLMNWKNNEKSKYSHENEILAVNHHSSSLAQNSELHFMLQLYTN